jgi:hypothetical protein
VRNLQSGQGGISVSNRAAFDKMRGWREKIERFAWDHFQFKPDVWQREAFDAWDSKDPDKQRISLQACAGPGKTAVLAILIWHFLATQGIKGNHPKGAATSITGPNLDDNLWPELFKWQSRSAFLKQAFTWTKTRIFANDHPETWFVAARTWPKTANADEQGRTLSGLHSDYVLAVIDESGGVPPSVLKAAEQALSTGPKFGKIVQAGNPISLDGMLYEAAVRLRKQWHVIRITGDPDDPRRSPRIDIAWAKEQIENFGRDNPWVMAYILGQFPPSSLNTLLGIEEVEAAMNKTLTEDQYVYSQKRLGCDFARFGDDRTVIFPRQGLAALNPIIMRNSRSGEIASRIMLAKVNWGSECELCDDTGGYGAGVIDLLLQAGENPVAINFSGKADDPRYANKRAEMWFRMANWVKRGGALPKMRELITELTTPTYTFDKNGKLIIEPKDQIKKRLQFSPDMADALAITFGLPDMPAANPMNIPNFGARKQATVSEYDPFARERL